MADLRHGDYLATRHFGSLDGLRCLCIAAVLWHHGPASGTIDAKLASRGFVGVDFFFVISGFLITTLLLRERAKTGRISLKGFYWRRFLRIIPVYYFVITLVGAYYILAKGRTDYLGLMPYYYLFLSNYLAVPDVPMLGITWSLSVEEQYYVIWPLLLILVPFRWLPALLVALIALNLAAITGALRPLGIVPVQAGPLLFKMFNATFAPILLGSGAAVLLHSRRGFDIAARWLGERWVALPLFAAIVALLAALPDDLRGFPNMVLHLTMTAALIAIVIREDNALRPLLTFRPIERIGQISYGVYLYHMIALTIVAKAGIAQPWPQTLAYVLLAIAMAEISFRTLEAWFQRLRHKPAESVGAA